MNQKIRIPTDTMEQEFAAYERRGYLRGKAEAERVIDVCDECGRLEHLPSCSRSQSHTAEPDQISAVINALGNYQQADADGVMVLVSRQACDEAIAALQERQPENDRKPITDLPRELWIEFTRDGEVWQGIDRRVRNSHRYILASEYDALRAACGEASRALQAIADVISADVPEAVRAFASKEAGAARIVLAALAGEPTAP